MTFSQLIDELMAETLRPDMRANLVSYVNLTIRELHIDPASKGAVKFTSNLVEVELTADTDTGFTYEIPKAQLFQKVEAVYYERFKRYARERYPSSAHAFESEVNGDKYFYRTGNHLAFAGYGGDGATIKLAYFRYPKRLEYYATAARPMTWSESDEAYSYLPAYDVDDTTRENAQYLTTNWIIERHQELVKQGAAAKLYSRLKDVDRARLAYSLYEQLRPGFVAAESHESLPIYTR